MENFRAEVVREILAIEGNLSDFQKRQEQTLRVELQHSSENQSDATQIAGFASVVTKFARSHD